MATSLGNVTLEPLRLYMLRFVKDNETTRAESMDST
jgi:hypothetical protein